MRQKNNQLLAFFLVLSSIILFLIAVPAINAANLNTKIEFQISGLSGVSQLDNTAGTSVKVYISNSTGIVVSRNAAAGIYLNNMTVSMTGDKFNLSYATSYTYILSTIYGNFSYNFTTPTAPSTAVGIKTSFNDTKSYFTNMGVYVYDSQNSLDWQNGTNEATVTWADAITYCSTLNLAGKSVGSWRLPSLGEYLTLMNWNYVGNSYYPPAFSTTDTNYYWTSTTVPSYTDYAYYVVMDVGYVYGDSKVNPGDYLARCVSDH